ncbi:GNAT family N-acetyltransferase [Arthrobacter sp. Sr24]
MNPDVPVPFAPLPTAAGLLFRPMTQADAQPWFELVQRMAQADSAPWHEQLSDLLEVLASTTNPAALNTVAGVDADGELRAVGFVTKNPASDVGYAMGGVDPLWRRRGIGAAVLAWQCQVLRGRSLADGTGVPVVRSYVMEVTAGHSELMRAAAFVPVRTFTEMALDLAQIPDAPLTPGVSIVPFTPDLTEAVRRAHNEAFADHWGSEQRSVDKWSVLMAHENFRPEWTSVALDDATGEVAGYQISMFDPTVLAATGHRDGYTELLGVRRAWRGRKIAPALLIDAMTRYAGAAMERATLDVDTLNPTGALGMYERMGYRALPGRSSVAWDLLP